MTDLEAGVVHGPSRETDGMESGEDGAGSWLAFEEVVESNGR
jgi:hypothetical protein